MIASSTTSRRCSFCSTSCDEVRCASGAGAYICQTCLQEFHAAMNGTESAGPGDASAALPDPFARAGDMSKPELLDQFSAMLRNRSQVDSVTREWVAMMKQRSVSWTEIGRALGITRQAAWERFTRPRAADRVAD